MVIGRPVGSTNDRTWRSALVRAVNRRTDGKGSPKKLDMIADKCADEAMNGESWAVREVGDRLDGKPAQAIAIRGDPDSPVIFNLRLGDGIAPKVIDGGAVEVLPDALTGPLVAEMEEVTQVIGALPFEKEARDGGKKAQG
jgi:hypothetical protein